MFHQTVGQSFDDGASDLTESLLLVSTGSVRNVNVGFSVVNGDQRTQGDVGNVDIVFVLSEKFYFLVEEFLGDCFGF